MLVGCLVNGTIQQAIVGEQADSGRDTVWEVINVQQKQHPNTVTAFVYSMSHSAVNQEISKEHIISTGNSGM